eukprot:29551-Pyramimonas_sp.AAC.1
MEQELSESPNIDSTRGHHSYNMSMQCNYEQLLATPQVHAPLFSRGLPGYAAAAPQVHTSLFSRGILG